MKSRTFAPIFVLAVLAGIPAAAQTTVLQGTVTDIQGGLIPTAIVTVTNQDTSAARQTVSDNSGAYVFQQMAPGPYKIQVQRAGFTTYASEVRLQINTPLTLNIELQLGQVSDTVNVTAEATTVNTQNSTIGNPFLEVQVRQLPLQTRNVVELLSLQPGVTPTGEVVGARKDQNNITLDGVDVNDNQNAGVTGTTSQGFNAALPVPLDSVQEFRTTVAGQGADQGRSSGGQVSLVTKGGSNQFHGSAYEYMRNTATAANNWFSNRAGIPRQALVRNQYGASLGGRFIRDRAFFFLNWEDRKDRSATAVTRTVPSESFKQGIVKVLLTNGQTIALTPGDIKALDPLHLGESSYMFNYLKQYPTGNDPASASDRGLNFNTLRFNAPQKIDNRAYVARMDFNLDRNGKHTLMLRGTLNDGSQDLSSALAQFPGQAAASKQVDTSRGLAARYTAVISPTMVNVFGFGYTRIGTTATGNQDVLPSFGPATPTSTTRPSVRLAPTTNFVDDMTWTHGLHTIQTGLNFRIIENDRLSFNNLPSYSFSRNTLLGLGNDITNAVTSYLASNYGGGTLSSGTNVTNAFGAAFGLLNSYGATYNFGRDGTAIPFGQPVERDFADKEYELYAQDSYRVKSNLTLTYGLRWSLFGVPYEKNGVQVIPQTSLNQFFVDRASGQGLGMPSYAHSTAAIVYNLGGPVNNGPGWYSLDKNNFAPRIGMAWSPDLHGLAGAILGKGTVIRAGAGMIYDRYGSQLTVNFANSGSPGLATNVSQPLNTDFTTGFRYTGSGLPVIPAAPTGGFPFTPPTIVGGFNSFTGISNDLKAPYQYLLNFSVARPLPKRMSIEVGYVGRLSHGVLLTQDYGQPLTQFRDPKSGQTWAQASGILRDVLESGVTPAQVKANPNLVPLVPFVENMFAKDKNVLIPGSASANYWYTIYNKYAGSDLDALNDMDRLRLADGTCISVYGCNTFFPLQNAGLPAWTNAGKSAYHGMQIVLRRGFSRGWGFDLNYTWSHSIDNAGGTESGGGAGVQDAFNPLAYRGPSDFDIRHNLTANYVVEIPIGRDKKVFGKMPKALDAVVGGWQISSLVSLRSGTPINITNSGVYPTNYLNSSIAQLRPGATMPATAAFDQTGTPSIFANTNAYKAFMGEYPGQTGTRGIVRRPAFFNSDLSISKVIKLPFEGHTLQIRAEGFNAFNNVNFTGSPQLSIATPNTFGQITSAADARVMQFAMRYEF